MLKTYACEIEQAGRCFITEAGFHPGLPAALVRYAATHFDTIDAAITAGYLNMGEILPYSEAVDELIESFKDYQAQVFRRGEWTKPGSFTTRKIDFGGDIGWKRCYPMFFEELRAIPEMYPTINEVGFYISEMHWMTDWIIMPIAWMGIKFLPNAQRPIGRFLWWGMQNFHKPPYRVELQVQASGITNGQPCKMTARVAHLDGYELTAIPVVAALRQYLDGTGCKPGLWMMGHLVDPVRLMEDMAEMGVLVTTRMD
jgi:hypothetical protein